MNCYLALLFLVATLPLDAAERKAKNVILFLGDAGGIATLNAASIHGYGHPQRLFVQRLDHIALMDTSSASQWVSDSAAGMTAIVTGRKTNNGVVSQSSDAVRGKKDGAPLKTILEYAEERGLSTGVVTNSPVADATPAACYAHANDRGKTGEIFAQILTPRFGDGVDVVIGPGRDVILAAFREKGIDVEAALKQEGRGPYDSIEAVPADAKRPVVLLGRDENDLTPMVERSLEILSRNPKGFFLMVESNIHTDRIIRGLDRTVAFDRLIERVAKRFKNTDTLVLFTADHSYDFRVVDGDRNDPLFTDEERRKEPPKQKSERWAHVRRDDTHSGEEVLLAAQGPGSERVKGFLANTDVFHIMLQAFGWTESTPH